MALQKREIAQLYRRRAKWYDIRANLYYLLGFRGFAYRKMAVRALNLKRGDTVVEIGCGTGLNFRFLQKAIGPEGKIIGVDLTPEMLSQASKRIERHHWSNIELVQSDASAYHFPVRLDGIISTFAITLIPEYDQVIRNGVAALSAGKRFAILDLKMPSYWPRWFGKPFVFLMQPFGITLDLAERHPWESLNRYTTPVLWEERYFGGVYLCVGEAPKIG